MPFAFLIVGLMLLVIGVRNQTSRAIKLLQGEFTGSGSFIQWFLAIFIVGAIGYWKPAKPFSDAFMGLIILTMIIANENKNGLFAKFEDALQNSPATPPSATGSDTTGGAATGSPSPATTPASALPSATAGLSNNVSWLQSLFGGSQQLGAASGSATNFAGSLLPNGNGNVQLGASGTVPDTGLSFAAPGTTNGGFLSLFGGTL